MRTHLRLSTVQSITSYRIKKLLCTALFFSGTLFMFAGLFFNVTPASAASAIIVQTGSDPVVNGTALQKALNDAQCGDTIVLQAGATYQGPPIGDQAFVLPYKGLCTGTDADFITIQTSNLADLGGADVRIDPATKAAAMPKLVADVSSFGMVVIAPQLFAHHYRLIGLEITTTGTRYAPNLVNIYPNRGSGPTGYPTYEETIGTHDFIIDRCFIHPAEISASNLFPSTSVRTAGRGINAEGINVSILNSYIAGFAGRYPSGETIDSMGIYTVAGPGPIRIVNNYIEAQFNNIFLGGADNYTLNTATVSSPTLTSATLSNVNNLRVGDLVAFSSAATTPYHWETGQVNSINGNTISFTLLHGAYQSPLIAPDDYGTARWNGINLGRVEIRRNFLNKPDAWNAFSSPKAFIEVKECVDCIVDGNTMYTGVPTTFALTPRNQAGSAPWQKIENLTYTNNVMMGYATGIVTQGSDNEEPSVPSGHWVIRNNLFLSPKSDSGFLQLSRGIFGAHDVSVTHNTILQPGNMIVANGVTEQFVLNDNIVGNGYYGINCLVDPNILSCLPGLQMTGNVIVGPPRDYGPYCTNKGGTVYPPGNNCVDTADLIGFTDLVNNNYRLASTSPYKGKASDGTDPGVDMDVLLAAQGGSIPPAKSVTITDPLDGATINGTVTVSAEASPEVTKVDFFLDSTLGATSTAPFDMVLDTKSLSNGTHSIMAKGYDGSGNTGYSNPIGVTVSNEVAGSTGDVTAPITNITWPSSSTTLSGTVSISAAASDNVGVTKVEFLVDNVLFGASSASPYTQPLDTTKLANASHSLASRAYDAAGNVGTSAAISVNVNNLTSVPVNTLPSDTTSPTVTVTTTVNSKGVVTLAASATDDVGVVRVEFYIDGKLNTTFTAPPYATTLRLSGPPGSKHSAFAKAYDAAGNVGTSSMITLTKK